MWLPLLYGESNRVNLICNDSQKRSRGEGGRKREKEEGKERRGGKKRKKDKQRGVKETEKEGEIERGGKRERERRVKAVALHSTDLDSNPIWSRRHSQGSVLSPPKRKNTTPPNPPLAIPGT